MCVRVGAVVDMIVLGVERGPPGRAALCPLAVGCDVVQG